jgi:8-oxo-dGTP pyrophosphatase MutT (NUDIX family)
MSPSADFFDFDHPQTLPVPTARVDGDPSPWSHRDDWSNISLAVVRRALAARQQNWPEHDFPRNPLEHEGLAAVDDTLITRRSSVLIALFEEDGEARVILTRRSSVLPVHRGEVAFPGGRTEEGETAIDGALREAQEEVGLAPDLVTVTGWLTPLVTFSSGSAIWPIVGELAQRPPLRPDEREVERIFDVALADLLAPNAHRQERWHRDTPRLSDRADGSFPVNFFRAPGDLIWGATARILVELLSAIAAAHD